MTFYFSFVYHSLNEKKNMKDTGINKNFKRFSINPNPENYLCEQRNSVYNCF